MATKEYNNNYYHTKVDKKRKIKLQMERLTKHKQFLWDYLIEHPCVDCGLVDPVVAEFDHVRGTKTSSVSQGLRNGWSIDRLIVEIDKCDVRCANCHRRKTFKELNWFQGI